MSKLYTFWCLILALVLTPALEAKAGAVASNTPTPGLGSQVGEMKETLRKDPVIQAKIKTDRALKALYIQTMNHLRHVSFSFTIRDATYTHDYVLTGPYPYLPTQLVLKKAEELIAITHSTADNHFTPQLEDKTRQQELLQQQKDVVNKITNDSFATYQNMSQRLRTEGIEASFPELGSVALYLELKLNSDPTVIKLCSENKYLLNFRSIALSYLKKVINPDTGKPFPYMPTLEAIQRTMEFYDVLQRANDPTRSPKLYHSDRYDYYAHFLKGQVPDHIIMPTLVSLGATDILKARGVPIGFIGVNTDITWVDGYYQTPYEFWIHDINHSRRMFQFFKEKAEELGISIEEFARRSDQFMKEKLLPVIAIKKTDDNVAKNKKRLIKVLLFEILHEDALAAYPDIIKNGVLRPPNLITPFERIDDSVVSYVMEPGATTLAYVFRKLAHDFYDIPGSRVDNIVAEEFRTREYIVEAAETLFAALGFKVNREILEYYVSTDEGFPHDFKQTIARDIKARPNATIPLDQEATKGKENIRAQVADTFHGVWQQNSGYSERWKVAHAVFKDGRGINDDFKIGKKELPSYLAELQVPKSMHKYFAFRLDVKTGKTVLHEDIQHLPNKFLAPNLQFENIKGASSAVDIIESLSEKGLEFRTVEQAMDWIRESCQQMNIDWLQRNGSWAKEDPQYNRHWNDLAAGKQQNGMNLLKISLDVETQFHSQAIAKSQRTLLNEAIRRVELDIRRKRDVEVRAAVSGKKIHEAWQKKSNHKERWKPTDAKLLDGTPVTTSEALKVYFFEKKIPKNLQKYFQFNVDSKTKTTVLYEDIQNLPYEYLAPNHQKENLSASEKAVELVDHVWNKKIVFKTVDQAERWLRGASQVVHQAVLERNANGARENPIYNRHWTALPPINQSNDLEHIKIAFEARLRLNPDGMAVEQRNLITEAITRLEIKITTGEILRKCVEDLSDVSTGTSLAY